MIASPPDALEASTVTELQPAQIFLRIFSKMVLLFLEEKLWWVFLVVSQFLTFYVWRHCSTLLHSRKEAS